MQRFEIQFSRNYIVPDPYYPHRSVIGGDMVIGTFCPSVRPSVCPSVSIFSGLQLLNYKGY